MRGVKPIKYDQEIGKTDKISRRPRLTPNPTKAEYPSYTTQYKLGTSIRIHGRPTLPMRRPTPIHIF